MKGVAIYHQSGEPPVKSKMIKSTVEGLARDFDYMAWIGQSDFEWDVFLACRELGFPTIRFPAIHTRGESGAIRAMVEYGVFDFVASVPSVFLKWYADKSGVRIWVPDDARLFRT
jgi:hypothetical protein